MIAALRPAFILAAGLLSACQSGPAVDPAPAASGKSAALRTMEQVAIPAHRCWFASGDPAFASFSFANELNSFSGRPRFLLVPENDFGGRPLLVVEAKGEAGAIDLFGPLLDQPVGPRVRADIARWASGSQSCGAQA
ncbi:hypothetical protein [Pararhizobium haloflavum]|uniref:hypothetical protein n=1 Tax=Pararhizobium haloflavum TaxID=2037914 RepID=UPI000C184792|nr:hypothetical protein [Pararhizobium haloflavum]